MRRRIILVLIITFLILPYKVKAECSAEKINDLKKIADNITAVSQYDEENAKVGNYGYNIITIYGLIDGFYATNRDQTVIFNYSDSIDGSVSETVSSDFGKLNIFSNSCPNQVLKSIDLDLKKLNLYYDSSECSDIQDEIDVCSRFYNSDKLSYNSFLKEVNEYKEKTINKKTKKNDLISFIMNNILIISIGAFIVFIGCIYLVIHNVKKNRLD